MLLYSKKVDDKKIVFYSENGIPTSDDIELTYNADNDTYYAIETFRDEKKVRITCTYKKRSKRTRKKEKSGREKGKNYVRK